jgi:hypothetical protein
VLPHLTGDGSSALLIDANSLAIDATDPTLAAEIDRVDTKAGAAVLHYRTAAGLEKVATEGAVASRAAGIDALVEQVLVSIADGDTVRLDMDGQKVLAGRVARTGWLLVLMRWYPSLVVSSARASAR